MKKKIFLIIIFFIVLIGSLFTFKLINKNKTDDLIGLWDIDGNTKYEFDGKGNGKIIVPLANYEFTYTIEKENIIIVDFKDEKSRDTKYEYKVTNETLELTDINQSNINLKLKKVSND